MRQLHTYECRKVAALFLPDHKCYTYSTYAIFVYIYIYMDIDAQWFINNVFQHRLPRHMPLTTRSKCRDKHPIPKITTSINTISPLYLIFSRCLFYFHLNILAFEALFCPVQVRITYEWIFGWRLFVVVSPLESEQLFLFICAVDFNLIQFTSWWWRKRLQLWQNVNETNSIICRLRAEIKLNSMNGVCHCIPHVYDDAHTHHFTVCYLLSHQHDCRLPGLNTHSH